MQLTVLLNIGQSHDILEQCLTGLMAQTLGAAQFEILIPTQNGIAETIAAASDQGLLVKQIDETSFGHLIENAVQAPLVACLSSDVVPAPHWAAEITAAATNHEAAIFRGNTHAQWRGGERPLWITDWMLHAYGCSCAPASDYDPNVGNVVYRQDTLRSATNVLKHLSLDLLTGRNVVSVILKDQGAQSIGVPDMETTRPILQEEQTPEWLSKTLFKGGRIAAKQAQFLTQHLREPPPWADIRPPTGMRDWEAMVNLLPDGTLEETLIKIHDLGFLLGQVGLLD